VSTRGDSVAWAMFAEQGAAARADLTGALPELGVGDEPVNEHHDHEDSDGVAEDMGQSFHVWSIGTVKARPRPKGRWRGYGARQDVCELLA
jgi:hypothetical protein